MSDISDYMEHYYDIEEQAYTTAHAEHVFKLRACALTWFATVCMYLVTWKLGIPELMCYALWIVVFPLFLGFMCLFICLGG
ncbi:hypothetical protein DE146DRAFT_750795 [Phaeosphaeria sp. MPI-PUGE-AT-0046c]|nr:hypothetical protein DE146DRAFT_750795 [Phaeosphaeria sp. MPI-PUGE-AT-0046c]